MITATIPNDNKWDYKKNNGIQPIGDDVLVDVNMIWSVEECLGVAASRLTWGKEDMFDIGGCGCFLEDES